MIRQKKWYDVERYKMNIGAIGFFVLMQTSILFSMFLAIYMSDTGRMATAYNLVAVTIPVYVIFVWVWVVYVVGDLLINMAQWWWQKKNMRGKIFSSKGFKRARWRK